MVYGKSQSKMDDLKGYPYFRKPPRPDAAKLPEIYRSASLGDGYSLWEKDEGYVRGLLCNGGTVRKIIHSYDPNNGKLCF